MPSFPATIYSELVERANLVVCSSRIGDVNIFEAHSIIREAQKLKKVDIYLGWIIEGTAKALLGDADGMRSEFDAAIRYNSSDPVAPIAYMTGLGNLGYFSEMLPLFAKYADPRLGQFTSSAHLGLVCCAFHTLRDFVTKADTMRLEYMPAREQIDAAVSILDEKSMTDNDVGTILDVAGTVLRDGNIMFDGHVPNIRTYSGMDSCISIAFKVKVSPEQAATMNMTLAERLAERFDSMSDALVVSFESIQ